MEPQEQDKTSLISDIESDAKAEAAAIVKEAETRVAEKKRFVRQQVESILNEARVRAQDRAETIRRKAIWAAQREAKRRSLRRRADVAQDVLDRVEQRLAALIDEPAYRSALVDWIAQAAMGLDAHRAEVNASEKERARIDEGLLAEAAREVQEAAGRQVVLELSAAPPLAGQGVVLTASDGRTAFNNQVKTRMLRNRRRIHAMIHDCLFVEEQNSAK
ncbi:MAG TPA: V-type ATP synthase subunit E family protein [Sedimentisphaerales bacterium]|jgi:vacuolar-type H+-ATPase subunit E/Vma4|nr:V-type ATP synthase subunit E family protein [Sedimentisphaerales bacterium]HNU28123.1 V-type ATP synthase subunit E family protein [Sedimentisphaerales bacterium]